MTELCTHTTRGSLVESIHRVSAVVVDDQGRQLAWSGHPDMVTFWRSAAKPFQALPLLVDGAAERFGLTDQDLALICASHSSEPVHLAAIDQLLERIGHAESDLGCGGHTPLSDEVARAAARCGEEPSARWSNCSGNHAGMLALASHHGWSPQAYFQAGHPVQDRLLEEVSRWTDQPTQEIVLGVDGCNAVCYGLPLSAMALAYARLGTSHDPAAHRVRSAMVANPTLVGGLGRPCTDIMIAGGGMVVAKIGAEGVYGATLPEEGLGVALKVEDGAMRSAAIALLAVMKRLTERGILAPTHGEWLARTAEHATIPIVNTRGEVTGALEAAGELHYSG